MQQENHSSENKRIAKNTVMLYVRMVFTMFVGLFTSRVVLNTLGVEDYGTYAVVGGVTAMMGFLNASMSSATSRFITYEMGRGNKEVLRDTFNSAFIVHCIIALIIFIAAETIGLWFLHNKLVIPEGRMFAADIVYQFSIIGTVIGITQVPYSAVIVSHEHFDIYAYFEMLNTGLRLLIVYLLMIGNYDKLILYGFLSLAVSILMISLNRWYCSHKFEEARLRFVWNPRILKPMLSFSGWDLYGNMSVTANNQGMIFLVNMFFGVVYNASANIANTVTGVVTGFVGALMQATRPQIIKQYAQGNIERMQVLMANTMKFQMLLFSLFAVPLSLEIGYVLHLWLGIVPIQAGELCQLTMLALFIQMTNAINNTAIHATGNIRRISFITGSLMFVRVAAVYITYKLGCPFVTAYWIQVIGYIVNIILNTTFVKIQIPTISVKYILKTLLPVPFLITGVAIITLLLRNTQEESFLRLVATTLSYIFLLCISTYFLLLDKGMKEMTIKKAKYFLHL